MFPHDLSDLTFLAPAKAGQTPVTSGQSGERGAQPDLPFAQVIAELTAKEVETALSEFVAIAPENPDAAKDTDAPKSPDASTAKATSNTSLTGNTPSVKSRPDTASNPVVPDTGPTPRTIADASLLPQNSHSHPVTDQTSAAVPRTDAPLQRISHASPPLETAAPMRLTPGPLARAAHPSPAHSGQSTVAPATQMAPAAQRPINPVQQENKPQSIVANRGATALPRKSLTPTVPQQSDPATARTAPAVISNDALPEAPNSRSVAQSDIRAAEPMFQKDAPAAKGFGTTRRAPHHIPISASSQSRPATGAVQNPAQVSRTVTNEPAPPSRTAPEAVPPTLHSAHPKPHAGLDLPKLLAATEISQQQRSAHVPRQDTGARLTSVPAPQTPQQTPIVETRDGAQPKRATPREQAPAMPRLAAAQPLLPQTAPVPNAPATALSAAGFAPHVPAQAITTPRAYHVQLPPSVPEKTAAPRGATRIASNPNAAVKPAPTPAPNALLPGLPTGVFAPETTSDSLLHLTVADENIAHWASLSSHATTVSAATPIARAQAPQVAAQLATSFAQSGGGTTEIALNPEELGRVRMTLTTGDHGLTLVILAERPETADLMRRNLDLLIAEFEDLGHDTLAFSFGDETEGSDGSDGEHATGSQRRDEAPDVIQTPSPSLNTAASGGLDLKL